MHIPGILAWRPLAIGVAIGGLAVGGGYYGATHLAISPFTRLTAQVATDTGSAPPPVAVAPPTKKAPIAPPATAPGDPPPAIPNAPGSAAPGLQPGLGGPVVGQVTALSQNPASFTIHTSTGDDMTYRVLDTTVFSAGRDRPYNFGLLQVGDEVHLRGKAGPPAVSGGEARQAAPQHAQKQGPDGVADAPSAEPVARFVVVRPAGGQRGGLLGHAAGEKKGAGHGLNQ